MKEKNLKQALFFATIFTCTILSSALEANDSMRDELIPTEKMSSPRQELTDI